MTERLLAELDRSANISLARPPGSPARQARPAHSAHPASPAPDADADAVESATLALRQAARRSAPFALVPADPLAAVATQWQSMWDVSRGSVTGAVLFEEQAAHALAAWRAGRFELPDYYLVLAGIEAGEAGPDFYLGPVRAARPHRVAVVAATDVAEQAAGVLDALRSLRHGPWWPPVDELLDTARRFFAGGLAEAGSALATPARR